MSLVARHLEANGLPTMVLGSALDILQAGRPPRTTFVDYPLGHSAGKAFDPADQYSIVRAAMLGFTSMTTPGELVRLPNRWADNDDWQRGTASPEAGDTREARDDSPRFQLPADRDAAISSGALRA